jgi:hypothetical protein
MQLLAQVLPTLGENMPRRLIWCCRFVPQGLRILIRDDDRAR